MPDCKARATANAVAPLTQTLMRCVRFFARPPLNVASAQLAPASQAGYSTSSTAATAACFIPMANAAATQAIEKSARV